MDDSIVFNPLDKGNLGKSVVDALLAGEEKPLESIERFSGAGVYAIYYRGDFASYHELAALNRPNGTYPIYVGKAVPSGGRKGASTDVSLKTKAMSGRLLEHKESIQLAPSLAISDFSYRALVVDDIWISLGEALVIQRFKPLWNVVVEGFGNHDPGKGRYGGMRPMWDEMHPGRPWAERCNPPKTDRDDIIGLVRAYCSSLQKS